MNDITKKHIIIEEQGLRDGIQNLDHQFDTDRKVALIHELIDAGLKRIQVASFVHPRMVPQMADAEAVCAALPDRDDVLFSGLVLNLRGVQRGIDAGLKHLACSISASDTHSQKNARKTLAEARSDFKSMVSLCLEHGVTPRGGIQCAFGCRYEGKIDRTHVYDMVKAHLDDGVEELAVADSTGMAHPLQMEEMMNEIVGLAQDVPVILHLHNTENKGYANIYAAVRSGVKIFDTAFGGLGGCPFIKSATGNVATEDTVHMLHQMGYETGIHLDKLSAIATDLSQELGYDLPGNMYTLLPLDDIKVI